MRALSILALLPMLATAAIAHQPAKGKGGCGGCCEQAECDRREQHERAVARQLVEAATGGKCVSFRRMRINGSTRDGFEIEVHMPGKDKGWRCEVDMDNPPKIYRKKEIPNPPPPRETTPE